jgi:hypothetical protein
MNTVLKHMIFVVWVNIALVIPANAGLFDDLQKDLQKMQKQMEQMQSGNIQPSPFSSGNSNISSGMSTAVGGSASDGMCGNGATKETVDCVCQSTWREGYVDASGIFKKLPSANIQAIKPDFSVALDKINSELNQLPKASEQNTDVASLELYRNAFETGIIASLYSQFLETRGKKAAYMSIMKQVADAKSSFDTHRQAIKRDAQQAYGIMLLYYQSRGANASTGMAYLKAAGKGDPRKAFIATYHIGHRAYFGIGERRDLSKAASWMLKSYEAVEDRKLKDARAQTAIPLSEGFIRLVTDEFMSLVSEPDYARRELYADLINIGQAGQASLAKSMQDAKGRSPKIEAITKAYLRKESEINAKILRTIGQEERATIEEQRIQKFVDDQSKDAQKYKDYSYTSNETRQFLINALKSVNTLEDSQKQEFSEAMRELALLTIEMDRINRHIITQFTSGKIDLMQVTVASEVFASVKITCKLYDDLNNIGTKVGAPKADVVFDSDSEDTVINMAMD